MADTAIEWATKVWNPVLGCEPVSEGCKNCYAQKFHNRLRGQRHPNYQREFWESFIGGPWLAPFNWKKPERIFVCSMGDFFYEGHDTKEQWKIWLSLCRQAKQLTRHRYLVLTKRASRMADYVLGEHVLQEEPLPNLWLGVTVENQRTADERLPYLAKCKADGWHTFVSCEPLLEEVLLIDDSIWVSGEETFIACGRDGEPYQDRRQVEEMLPAMTPDWVIAGPETGPGKRPCDPKWLAYLQQQAGDCGVPFFLKKQADGSPAPRELQQFPDELILPQERVSE